jgi:hypothetical protein
MNSLKKGCLAQLTHIKNGPLTPDFLNNLHKPGYRERYVQEPLRHQEKNRDILAPHEVQQFAHMCLETMLANNLPFFDYLTHHGYPLVYDGPDKENPHYFMNTGALAYSFSHGGIHVPNGSFLKGLTPPLRFLIGHEIGHLAHGDLTKEDNARADIGSPTWFNEEYNAHAACTTVLYEKFRDYGALETEPD